MLVLTLHNIYGKVTQEKKDGNNLDNFVDRDNLYDVDKDDLIDLTEKGVHIIDGVAERTSRLI